MQDHYRNSNGEIRMGAAVEVTDPKFVHQVELERLFNKNQLIPRIRKEFQDEKQFTEYMEDQKIPVQFGLDLLVQMCLHKRAKLTTLIGCLRHHFQNNQLTADMIYKAAQANLLFYNSGLRMFIIRFDIAPEVQAELDRFQFPLPMVVPPFEVKNNRETGYITSGGSIILRHNHHDHDVCLDHINRVNQIRFVINQNTVRMVKNKWRNLDKPKSGETKDDFNRRKRAFEKYDRSAKDVIQLLLKEGNEFYLTHRYDKRGRIYCQGYHVTYQGAPWNKAVIEFAEQEIIE